MSANDVVVLLSKMAKQELVSPDSSRQMLSFLLAEPQSRRWLGASLPNSWEVGSNYGYLPPYYLSSTQDTVTVNDSTLVLTPGPYAVAILCTGYQEGIMFR